MEVCGNYCCLEIYWTCIPAAWLVVGAHFVMFMPEYMD